MKQHLDSEAEIESNLYSIGEWFIKLNKNHEENLGHIKKIAGDDWKNFRFENVVRLGADIKNAGLSTLPRATLVGAFLYQNELRRAKQLQ